MTNVISYSPPKQADVAAGIALAESSQAALQAAEAGDLEAVKRALDQRQAAIDRGAIPTAEAILAGDQVRQALEAFKRRTGLESARVRQLQDGFGRSLTRDPHISIRG